MSSSGLTRGSHHIAVIAEIPSLRGAKRPKQSLGILEFSPELEFLGILEFLGFKLSWLSLWGGGWLSPALVGFLLP